MLFVLLTKQFTPWFPQLLWSPLLAFMNTKLLQHLHSSLELGTQNFTLRRINCLLFQFFRLGAEIFYNRFRLLNNALGLGYDEGSKDANEKWIWGLVIWIPITASARAIFHQ
jgi:hypothetical protein